MKIFLYVFHVCVRKRTLMFYYALDFWKVLSLKGDQDFGEWKMTERVRVRLEIVGDSRRFTLKFLVFKRELSERRRRDTGTGDHNEENVT